VCFLIEAITSTSTIENLLAAALFLMGYVTTVSNAALPLS